MKNERKFICIQPPFGEWTYNEKYYSSYSNKNNGTVDIVDNNGHQIRFSKWELDEYFKEIED